jgi:hypothetical protein
MEIPLNVEVLCDGKTCGRSTALIMNPVTDETTHIVVRETAAPHKERIVPVSAIERSEHEELLLKTTTQKFAAMEPFVETRFIRVMLDHYDPAQAYAWPYVVHLKQPHYIAEKEERIPPGEVAVHRGAKVVAADGTVGKVDEFLVGQEDSHVTHLVMSEGHLWGKRDVVIPISQIRTMGGETVYLKLTKKEVEQLPTIAVRRAYPVGHRPRDHRPTKDT